MTTRFVAILFAIAGCAIEGTELPVWTLSTGGQQVAITLPNNLEVAEGEAFTLRTEVPVPADLRGRALGLVADCYHGALEARVQRVPVEDDGDGAIGSWRFAIPASITSGDRLVLELVGKREPMSVIGFGAAPRLVDDPTGDPRARSVAAVNRIGATVALLTIGFLAIPYLAIYLLDRRRREYGAMLIYGLTLAHTPLTLLGAYSAFGPIGRHLWLTLGVSNLAALLLSVHSVFELEPVRRGWWIAIGGYAGLAIASPAFPALLGVVILLHGPLTIAVNGYTLVRFVLLARRGPFAFEARLILAGSLFSAAIMAQGVMWVRTGDSPLGGLHPMPIGIAVSMLLQAIVLAHQHVRRQRAVETANIDLQRQVAERSRELGDALRALGTSPPAAQPAESSSIGELRARFGDVVWARRAIAQLATQIAAIHAAGGVHRGVTLAALQIDGDEIRLAGADESHTIAARGGAVATAADDILALGRIAHELLTGVPAGSGELATLPSALAAIIARCLNADPARRPTADEIVSACSDGRRAS